MSQKTPKTVSINRAAVLTLWAAVVAQRLGFTEDEALTLGKAVAGLNAQAKGRRLNLFQPQEVKPKKARERPGEEKLFIGVCGRAVPARNTEEGIRAVSGKQVVDPDGVREYLDGKFGEDLPAERKAMARLARAYPPQALAEKAYPLYEQFRPAIPEGKKGWGARGDLDLGLLDRLAKKA